MKARLVSCDVIPRGSTLFSPFGIETPKRDKRVEDASAQKSSLRTGEPSRSSSPWAFIFISTFWLRGWLKVSKVINFGKHVIIKRRHDKVDIRDRIQLSSNRRNSTASSSQELILPPLSLLTHLHAPISHIINAATHIPQILEESSNTLLVRGPMVAMVTMVTSSRARETMRIRSIHGVTSSTGTEQAGSLFKTALETQCECFHLKNLSMHLSSLSPGLPVDQTLHILTIVRGHALQSSSLDLLKDEVTPIYLPKLLRLAIVQQVPMIAPDTSIISSLTHKILTEKLGKSVVVVVHP
jgi:hypothetical protein